MKLLKLYRSIPLIYLNLGAFVLGCLAGLLIWKGGLVWGDVFLSRILGVLSQIGRAHV